MITFSCDINGFSVLHQELGLKSLKFHSTHMIGCCRLIAGAQGLVGSRGEKKLMPEQRQREKVSNITTARQVRQGREWLRGRELSGMSMVWGAERAGEGRGEGRDRWMGYVMLKTASINGALKQRLCLLTLHPIGSMEAVVTQCHFNSADG